MSIIDEGHINEIKDFFENKIQGWMISDLERSIESKTNFLTALGCLTYTETIGIFLPPISTDIGGKYEQRFYRTLFRLESKESLMEVEKFLRYETGKGIYSHFRGRMSHKYFPLIIKRCEDTIEYAMAPVARDGFIVHQNLKNRSAPIFITSNSDIAIATKNYVSELKSSVNYFYQRIFIDRDSKWTSAVCKGYKEINT